MTWIQPPQKPKANKDESTRAAKRSLIREPHVEPLTRYVERLRREGPAGAQVPYFDPHDGGIKAEALFLLEAPGPKALASEFISRDNNDETAANQFRLQLEAGLERSQAALWNAVPWYIGNSDQSKIRPAKQSDLVEALPFTLELLGHFPSLKCIVLMGKKAQALGKLVQFELPVFETRHPSPLSINRDPRNRDKLVDELRLVAECLSATRTNTSDAF
ncbi:uracil-DNA glycosylase [Aurantiacibacter sp. MUD11]|uniref:uracil-DNA glycosylase n=1 Tax=Aurantiacibacter sp. MUD11 TaxID=3003265 RepID=UPI0022AB2C1C|nr:uracil-DNA glycosylase [Aurantiacibacter sp. MUD11]WAT19260.1 uracil-DNA glycosylase [Aurantiacibacter sp. MUD11]